MTRLRRSELATPASNDWMFESALRSAADLVFLDLEDATAEAEKESARTKVVDALRNLDWKNKYRAVRINHPESAHGREDVRRIIAEAGDQLEVIVVPKIDTVEQIHLLDSLVDDATPSGKSVDHIEYEVLIETPLGWKNAFDIATASPRVKALAFGAGDFSAEVGARYGTGFLPHDRSGDVWQAVRWRILVAARAAGIVAIDTPLPTYGTSDYYERQAIQAYHMGFDGKWAIHPSQTNLANTAFGPTSEDLRIAAGVVEAFDKALESGLGATSYDGVLLDYGNVRVAREMLIAANAESETGVIS